MLWNEIGEASEAEAEKQLTTNPLRTACDMYHKTAAAKATRPAGRIRTLNA